MSEEVRDFFHHSYDNVNDREKLRHIIKDIQAAGQSALKENASIQNQARARETELREQVDGLRKDVRARDKKLQSVGYSTRASHEPRWTQAEKDYPSDDAKVVFFDGRVFKVKSAKELQDDRVIISTFPSRWAGTVYVYTESPLAMVQGSDSRIRVTSKKSQVNGLVWSKTIHLRKLPTKTRLKVWFGDIKWLFLTQADSRRSTESES